MIFDLIFIPLGDFALNLLSKVIWYCNPNVGGTSHQKLNILGKPIANKYCEGKVKRTLKRE